MKIFKYVLNVMDEQSILMPPGDVLCVGVQKGRVCVWALVDPELPPAPRKFVMVGTGHVCDCDGKNYIGTVQLAGGDLVYHLFLV
jgi:hypothetical protein